MIAMVPLLLGLAALACAVVIMMRQTRAAGRRAPADAVGGPMFFARYRPGVTEVEPAQPVSGPPADPAPGAANAPADEKP